MIRSLFSALTSAFLILATFSAQAAEPLLPDDAFSLSASWRGDGIVLHWTIAPGYYLYRDQFNANSHEQSAMLNFPGGEIKDDENFGRVEVFHSAVSIDIPVTNEPFVIRYQGCQEAGLCYAQITKQVDPETLEITDHRGPVWTCPTFVESI